MKKIINTLQISGGGIRGIAYIGVFKKLEEIQKMRRLAELNENHEASKCTIPLIDIKTINAVSVGCLFSLIYILGYSYFEIKQIIVHKKFETLKNVSFMNFLSKYGIDSGNNLMKWLEDLMELKKVDKNITLKDFYALNNIDFQIMATNLNKYTSTKFNYICTPNVKVIDAIRMSISIPFMFTTNKYNGDIHVDGGLIDNFPIKYFENDLENVLGLKLVSHGEMASHVVNERIENIESYIYHVLTCYVVQKEKSTTMSELYKNHTIYIHTENITHTVNFSLTSNEKKKLIEIGYKAATNFFDTM